MINELYELSKALDAAGIALQSWHRKYNPLPKISAKAPCVRIMVENGKVESLSEVPIELGKTLRKYGTNQGTYPCMNLCPLYRVTDESVKRSLAEIKPEYIDDDQIERIKEWCVENNWCQKFQNKYRISIRNTPDELKAVLAKYPYEPLFTIIRETDRFSEPLWLHQAMAECVWRMLQEKKDVALAFKVLFHLGNSEKTAEDDNGTLSVVFDTPSFLQDTPIASCKFTFGLNSALLSADMETVSGGVEPNMVDAFAVPFRQINEPMPEAKLAGGFCVTLRTMFKEQRCQSRYGRLESASYPLSSQMRQKLQAALNWIGSSAENKEVTWISTDKNEILFAYPSSLPSVPVSFTRMFKRPFNVETTFKEQAKQFLTEIKAGRTPGTDEHASRIQLFVLRKIDKARTKIIYTRQTDPHELERYSEEWVTGCTENLPSFPFGQPKTPFPLDAADILNRFWKQNGELATDKVKPVPKYRGLELFMEPDQPAAPELHTLAQGSITLSKHLGNLLARDELDASILYKVKEMLAMMGLLLQRTDVRKENYMESFPYLYGQLLKVSDELHVLYCKVVRDGNFPPYFVGSSLVQSATETPIRTLNMLRQRAMPYLQWASSYRHKMEKESWRARWLLSLYERIATDIGLHWTEDTRLNDEEKAQLFIGYLAAFPKKEQPKDADECVTNDEEEMNDEH